MAYGAGKIISSWAKLNTNVIANAKGECNDELSYIYLDPSTY